MAPIQQRLRRPGGYANAAFKPVVPKLFLRLACNHDDTETRHA